MTRGSKLPVIRLRASNFLSAWLFLYVYRIGYWCWRLSQGRVDFSGQKSVPKYRHLNFELRKRERSRLNADLLDNEWAKLLNPFSESTESMEKGSSGSRKPSVLTALRKVYGRRFAIVGIWKIIWAVGTWLGAYYFLKRTIEFIEGNQGLTLADGHSFAVALLISSLVSSVAIHQLYARCNRTAIQVRSAISGLVYRKCLRVSRVKGGAGEVINILSADMARVVDGIVNFHFLWSAFLECIAILAITFFEIGISGLPALGFVLILLPIQAYLGKVTNETARNQAETSSERVHIMSEILTAIKLIKFYAWEKPFKKKITDIRNDEMSSILRGMVVKSVNFTVVFAVPVLIALACLGMYVGLGNTLTAAVSFSVLSVFNTLRYPFFMLPMAVRGVSGTIEAIRRLDSFMELDEVEPMEISENVPRSEEEDLACWIKDSDFKWDGAAKPALQGIDLKVKKGQKVAIIGDVGAGKTSLISALLGQIRQVRGDKLKVYGSTSYASQEPWLLNETLRDNVTFGMRYKKQSYKEVVRVCSLQRDLTLLVAGDMTEIAERGVNLSGGQRQRINLARAVYHDCEIVLLDDPLSAVDQHVGTHIFTECFQKHLKNKTIIMSIHQLQYLPQMDWIVMMKDGKIEKQGTYDDLMKYKTFKTLIETHVASDDHEEVDDDQHEAMNDLDFEIPEKKQEELEVVVDQNQDKQNQIQNQLTGLQQGHHHIDREQFTLNDLHQMSIRRMFDMNEMTISSMIEKNQLSVIRGGNIDFSKAAERNEMSVYGMPDEDDEIARERGKLVKEDTSTSSSSMADFATYARVSWGSLNFYSLVIFFFIVHGVRIASDYWLRLWIPNAGSQDGLYIGVYAALTVVFIVGIFGRGYWFALMGVDKAKYLHDALFRSIMRAPMAFFDSTPLGRILSAFSKHQMHVDDTLPDSLLQALQYAPLGIGALILCAIIVPWNWAPIIGLCLIAWLVVYLSGPAESMTKSLDAVTKPPLFAHLTATMEGLFTIRAYHAQKRFDDMFLEKLDTNHRALFAMILVKTWIALNLDILSSFVVYFTALLVVVFYQTPDMPSIAGLALSNALQMLVFVQWTVRMVGETASQMSSVGQLEYYGNNIPSEAPVEIPDKKPPTGWPEKGHIRFEKVGLRYTEFGVKVLKDISFSIYPTEKIGIVGRTGSGKSTLLISLLRIVEACDGRIMVDGKDISEMGLEDLRSNIAIIPQEPVLFKGTVRSNLDPFNDSSDEEIWKSLDAVHLGKGIREMPQGLDAPVIENGKNFSLGQRQLFCIARAILSKTKILVLDEATANVSPETDALIQTTIRENFQDVTVLTIAHRLNTIIDSDRILLLDAGKVLEFDDPVKLMDMKNGSFRDLVDQTGPATAKRLYAMAKEAQKFKKSKVPNVQEEEQPQESSLTIQQLASMKPADAAASPSN